ncbi:hypothetical protein Egran_02284 [Elaphomyces granulatus]|uniref:Zn(2)-C6 fungal-type domain-containing protein n=1 Tax=Elaphomyces granulatus TaxID=519963 RepID=A0A232M0N3_9EURO|nr:hypothetical protein Egran_02284 [Elaphomyces granulatus]
MASRRGGRDTSPDPSADEQKPKRPGNRQSRSCRVCRIRKVKCDRVKPCQACCAHGHPSKCVYDLALSDEDFHPVSQSDEIRNLRTELKGLRDKLQRRGEYAPAINRLAELERLFTAIRSAPPSVVERLIWQIRSTKGGHGRHDEGSFGASAGDRAWPPLGNVDDSDDESHFDFNAGQWSSGGYNQYNAYGPLSYFPSERPALDVFVERFVDAFSPEVDSSSGHAGALRAAADIRMFSPMISSAFEAVSLTFFGRTTRDPRIEASGMRRYTPVLRNLQDALRDPERSRAESTLVTVTLLLAFESIERTSQAGVTAHAIGAVRLLQHRGPENHMFGVEHLLFTELRPYWVGAALVLRKPSFFNEEAWKTIPWSAGTSTKDILHHLLDLAVEIPGLLGEADNLKAIEPTTPPDDGDLQVKREQLWERIADLTQRMQQWKKDWVDSYPAGPPREVDFQTDDDDNQFPIFHCRDLRTMQIVRPPTIIYPDLRLAQSMCVYSAYRVILSTIDNRPEGSVTLAEKYQLGCDIARSLECYIRRSPGNMVNRLALPVRVAWEVFPERGIEREFIKAVFVLVGQRHSLRLWGSSMPELSTRAGSP